MTTPQIHICTANIAQDTTLVDLFAWLVAAFQDIGGSVSASDKEFRGDVPNLIFESWNSRFKRSLDAHKGKIKLICFVTEPLDGGAAFDALPNGPERFREFMSIADHYTGFVTSVAGNVPFLRNIAPATFFEFGYSDKLAAPSTPAEWVYDYSFLGFLSPYRREFLEAASQRLAIHVPATPEATPHTAYSTTVEEYLETMRRTTLNIGLKQHARWKLPSPTKIGRALHATTGCAIEETEITTRQSRLVPTFRDVDDLCQKFGHLDKQKIHEDALARLQAYRETLPLHREILRNLDECPPLAG